MSASLPVTVIGGYLGAGKTTLVNHLLRHADGTRLAILVNEFGALPIDEDLIEAEDDDLISIAGGCVCCSFGSDLTAALADMAERSPRPDHVVIEASGVAMPGAIAANIGLMDAFALAGIIVLADSETIRRQAQDDYLGDTVLRQLSDADLVVQTKPDLADDPAAVTAWLQEASSVPVVRATQGNVPRDVLLGLHSTSAPTASAHADAGYDAEVFTPSAQDPAALAEALATGGYGLVRAKGFVQDEVGQTWLIQLVGTRAEAAPFARPMPSEIVCIGLKGQLDAAGLDALLA